MTHKISALLIGVAFTLVSGWALAGDTPANPFIGTWKLNIAKSKFEGTPTEVKSYSITNTDAGAGSMHSLAIWVDSDGTQQIEYTSKGDGKTSPVKGYANADSVRSTTTGPRSSKMALLKKGKVVEWGKYTISADGKVLNGTEGGTDSSGNKYKWIEVFERQ